MATYPGMSRRRKHRIIGVGHPLFDGIRFFDGATTIIVGGGGAVLYVGIDHFSLI